MNQYFKLPDYMDQATKEDLFRGAVLYVRSPIKETEYVKTIFEVNCRRDDWTGLIAANRLWIEITKEEFYTRITGICNETPEEEIPPQNQLNLFQTS